MVYFLVIQQDEIVKAFKSRSDAIELRKRIIEQNFQEAKQELGYSENDEELSEEQVTAIKFKMENDNGVCEIKSIDWNQYNEGEPIYLDGYESDYYDVKQKIDEAE